MNVYTASQAKTHFGAVIDAAQAEAVLIEKNGRPYVFVLSKKEYEVLKAMEDAYWLREAEEGRKSGYLSNEESEAFLKGLLDDAGS
jgi:prevent-host-death family protein